MALSMSALAFHYNVKKGDNLSTIAAAHYPGGIYGNKGNLKKIISLNPLIKNSDFIYPGQILKLDKVDPEVFAEASSKSNKKLVENVQDRGPAEEGAQISAPPLSVFIPFSTLSVLPKIKYQRISGTDNTNKTTAKIYSNESIGIDLDWLLSLV
jgi:LysM repeat protein